MGRTSVDHITSLAETLYREIGDTHSDWLQGRRGARAVAEQIDSLVKQRISEALDLFELKQEKKPCVG